MTDMDLLEEFIEKSKLAIYNDGGAIVLRECLEKKYSKKKMLELAKDLEKNAAKLREEAKAINWKD